MERKEKGRRRKEGRGERRGREGKKERRGVRKMAQWITCLICKHKIFTQNTCKTRHSISQYVRSEVGVRGWRETGGSQGFAGQADYPNIESRIS